MLLTIDLTKPFSRNSQFLNSRRSLVLACGCFDILTVGHVRHLKAAKRFGNSLIVLVTADRYINKGVGRPVFSEEIRAEVISSLQCVDFVIVNQHPTAIEAIRCLMPDFYVKGKDYKDNTTPYLQVEELEVNNAGGKLVFTDTEEFHTSEIIRRMK